MAWQENAIDSPPYPPCPECGKRHGRVGDEVVCLKRALADLRASFDQRVKEEAAALISRYGREARELPCTKGGSVEERRKGRKGS